jgi:hypothetical protein
MDYANPYAVDMSQFGPSENDRKRRLQMGLLAAGLSMLGTPKGREWQGIGRAGLVGLSAADQLAEDQRRDMLARLAMLRQGQELQEKRQAWDQQAQLKQLARSSMTPGMPEMGPPSSSGEMQPEVAPQFDARRYIQGMYGINPLAARKMEGELFPAKELKEQVTRVVNGQRRVFNVYKDGSSELQPFDPDQEKAHFANTGSAILPLDPFTGKPVGQGAPVTMSPSERDASARGWANYGLAKNADARAAAEGGQGKPPAGYRWTQAGGLEAIPGGPQDKSKSEQSRTEAAVNRADIVIEKVDQALKNTGFFTTGATGAALGKVPGTTAYDLRADVETIKANIGFNELQAMREASPTGGALGQVAVQELNALQATIANLDPNQNEAQLRRNLGKVQQHFNRWKQTVTGNGAPPAGAGATGGWSIKRKD